MFPYSSLPYPARTPHCPCPTKSQMTRSQVMYSRVRGIWGTNAEQQAKMRTVPEAHVLVQIFSLPFLRYACMEVHSMQISLI
jgi:hypothetical protein